MSLDIAKRPLANNICPLFNRDFYTISKEQLIQPGEVGWRVIAVEFGLQIRIMAQQAVK